MDAEKLFKRVNSAAYIRKRTAGWRAQVGEDIAIPLREQYPGILIKDITDAAIEAVESIDPRFRHPETAHWDWREFVRQFHSNLAPLQIAIWNQVIVDGEQRLTLHGLAIGRTTSKHATITVEALETFPYGNHPFCGEVLSIVSRFGGAYGALMGAKRLRLVNPTPGLIGYYSRAGFVIDTTQPILSMSRAIEEETDHGAA